MAERTLACARERLAVIEQQYARARQRSESVTPGGLTGYDSAILSGTTRHRNLRRESARHAAYAAEARVAAELARARREVEGLERAERQRAADELSRQRVTPESLAVATHVRDRFGWHKVVRVNAKSVSVESGYSWVDRLPIGEIIDVRPASGGEGEG